jgi:tRNA-Thr(GGU) m(6)t(6)A37 methyltransferase TsaA
MISYPKPKYFGVDFFQDTGTTVEWNFGVDTFDKCKYHSRLQKMIELNPIGIIRTPFDKPEGMPIQPAGGVGICGTIEVFEEFEGGLRDLDGFSHIILLYHFHQSHGFKLHVVPFMDSEPRGVFATRAPKRPNPIGISVVQLDKIESGVLYVQNVDILDGTPLIDIKPYVPEFDRPLEIRTGWLEQARKTVSNRKSDNRFRYKREEEASADAKKRRR